MSIYHKLAKLATDFDHKGFYSEAGMLDKILYELVSIASVESDLIQQYPDLENYITGASSKIEKKYLAWYAKELSKSPSDFTSAKLYDYIGEFKKHLSLLDKKDIYQYDLSSLQTSISEIKQYQGRAPQLAEEYFQLLSSKREKYNPDPNAKELAYRDARQWLDNIQPKFYQSLVRKEISDIIKNREVGDTEEMPDDVSVKSLAENYSDKIYEDDRFVVVLPGTRQASRYYGQGTQWCTAAKDSNQFANYSKEGVYLYYIIDKQNKDNANNMRKIAYCMTKDSEQVEIFNASDVTIQKNEVVSYLGNHSGIIDKIKRHMVSSESNKYLEVVSNLTAEDIISNPGMVSGSVEYTLERFPGNEDVEEAVAVYLAKDGDIDFFELSLNEKYSDFEKIIAEKWAEDGNAAFFKYKLDVEYPDLGPVIAKRLAEKSDWLFFSLGLNKKYPDFEKIMAKILAEKNFYTFFAQKLDIDYPEFEEVAAKNAVGEVLHNFFRFNIDIKHPEWKPVVAKSMAEQGNIEFFRRGLDVDYPKLLPIMAQTLADSGSENFFRYKLDAKYPKLEYAAAKTLIEKSPYMFFEDTGLGIDLGKKFPELEPIVAKVLAETGSWLFFHRGLNKKYEDLEPIAAEKMAEMDARYFFKLDMNIEYPEFEEVAAKKLAEDGDSYFYFSGLAGKYPDIEFKNNNME